MEKQDYDAWLEWGITHSCNLLCEYCLNKKKEIQHRGELKKINISALIKTLEKTKRIFKIGFSGGEPFLIPNIVEACQELSKKHYITFSTNTISKKIVNFARTINPSRTLQLTTALHIKELERLGLTNRFLDNVLTLKEKGFNIIVKVVAYPSLLNEIDTYKKFFLDKGITICCSYYIGKWNNKEYPAAYTKEEIKQFGMDKILLYNKNHYYKKGQLCNAGYNVGAVFIDGTIHPCTHLKKEIGNIYTHINFSTKMINCPLQKCACPFSSYDPGLYEKALQEMKKTQQVSHVEKSKEDIRMRQIFVNKKHRFRINCCYVSGKNQKNTAHLFSFWKDIPTLKLSPADYTFILKLKDGKYDVLFFELTNQSIPYIIKAREILGVHSHTQIYARINSPVELWDKEFNDIKTLKNCLSNLDIIAGSEPYVVKALKMCTPKQVYVLPTPIDRDGFKNIPFHQNKNYISILFHKKPRNLYIAYLITRNHKLPVQVIEYNSSKDDTPNITESLYHDLIFHNGYHTFIQRLAESKIIYIPDIYHVEGVFATIAAVMGIPVVGSRHVESIRRCFPHTAIDPFDIKEARKLFSRLLVEDDFYRYVSQYAKDKSVYYNYTHTARRIVTALLNETGDRSYQHILSSS